MIEEPSCKESDNKNTPWPDRLKASAASLCQLSCQLQEAINDERRFAILTNPISTNNEAVTEVRKFDRLLREALAALIDLTGYDNPEREFPDLKPWFKFEGPNVVFGENEFIIHIPPKP